MRDIVENGYKKVEGQIVDAMSAGAYVQVYDALTPNHQKDLESKELAKAMSIVWRLIKPR